MIWKISGKLTISVKTEKCCKDIEIIFFSFNFRGALSFSLSTIKIHILDRNVLFIGNF